MTERRPTERRRLSVPLAAALVLTSGCGPADTGADAAAEPQPPFPRPAGTFEVRLDPTHMVPMRDGVRLATDFYFPEGADEPLPVIQIRTPYGKLPHRGPNSAARWFASHGFAVAVQDMRGRFQSEGEYFVSRDDRRDGYDMVSWLAEQPWSNGRIGTYGCSYLGENQMQLAATRNPHHAAALPQAAGGSLRYFGVVFGGATELAASLGWFRGAGTKVFYRVPPGTPREVVLQVEEMINPAPVPGELDFQEAWRTLPYIDMLKAAGAPPTDFEAFVSHEPGDPWWDHIGYVTPDDRFDVPALHVNSWYDLGVSETLKLFNLLSDNAESDRARNNQFAIISPTDHCTSERATSHTVVGERDLGDARLDYWNIYLRWFDHWLRDPDERDLDERDPGDFDMPRLQYYLMGANEWRTADSWPVEGTEFRPMYLHSGGNANTRHGDGRLAWDAPNTDQPADVFTYDPDDPVPTIGGPVCCTGTADAPAGGFDQSAVEDRDDVLVYTSEPLAEALEVTGPIELVLHVSSDARDTDFVAKLVDVQPDGTPINVQEGILRARYREGYGRKVWMDEGEIHELRIDLQATANLFLPSHRIRLEVTSSSFPRWDRNLNTGGNNYDETEWVVARNSVHHAPGRASHVVLPVVPGSGQGERNPRAGGSN